MPATITAAGRAILGSALFEANRVVSATKVAWYDARKITGLADTAAVSPWSDSFGNGNDQSQATGTKQPLYRTNGANGQPYVLFDGVDDFLEATLTGLSGSDSACTIFMVMQPVSAVTAYHSFLGLGVGASTTNTGDIRWDASSHFNTYSVAASGGCGRVGTTAIDTSTTRILCCQWQTSQFPTLALTNVQEGTTAGTTLAFGGSPWKLRLGGNQYADAGSSGNVRIYQCIVYKGLVSSDEQAKLTTGFRKVYGL